MITEPCPNCQTQTETILLELSSGHIGRVCAKCKACRAGRPYAPRSEYLTAQATAPAEPPLTPYAVAPGGM